MAARVWIVADLGFGDSGKGTIVDYLVRARDAKLVVRWNGGAQAGHAVVTDDGREHVFSQFGAGTFVPGVRTHLAEPFVLHPTALLVEARHLAEKGVGDALDRLTIAESARVITPFHQAANRLRELARGDRRHGTCGVGFGEAVRDALACDDVVRARDLVGARAELLGKLEATRERLLASLGASVESLRATGSNRDGPRRIIEGSIAEELAILDEPSVSQRWVDALAAFRAQRGIIVPDEALGNALRTGPAVLEGAQGVLLDERHGFHPHTTWSDTTPAGACALLRKHGIAEGIERLGVLRTYLTRHGEGPFPSEAPLALPERHNASDGWQGGFRVGHQDLVLLRYAIRVSGGLDGLVLTHIDRPVSAIVTGYEGVSRELCVHDAYGRAIDLRPQADGDERLGQALRDARVVLERLEPDPKRLIARLEAALQLPFTITSAGPTASAKRELATRVADGRAL